MLTALKRACPSWQAVLNECSSISQREPLVNSATISISSSKSEKWTADCQQIAESSKPILIAGELGVGKENVARLIHSLSPHSDKPFVKVNCEAIQESFCWEMFFGKGDETDVSTNGGPGEPFRKGLIENAAGGILFLHNCTCLPKWLQHGLCEAAQAGFFYRQLGHERVPFSARLVASTMRDPLDSTGNGELLEEFYLYLKSNTLHVPPLRDRREEIPSLLEAQLSEASLDPSLRECCHKLSFTEDALRMLETYDWPGNLYELSGFVRRVLVFVNEPVVTAQIVQKTLPLPVFQSSDSITVPFVRDLKEIQRAIVTEVLKRTHGNKAAAARILSLHRKTLYRIIEGLPQESLRHKKTSA